jgi:predicted RNase H-like HicB family nuclease
MQSSNKTKAGGLAGSKRFPGVNSQGKTRSELLKNLRSALKEALEFNREDARAAAQQDYEEQAIMV